MPVRDYAAEKGNFGLSFVNQVLARTRLALKSRVDHTIVNWTLSQKFPTRKFEITI